LSYRKIFEDDFLLVVDKSFGVSFHNEIHAENSTLSEDKDITVKGLVTQIKEQGDYKELFPVHRLDKMTSGLLVIAKRLDSAQQLTRLFEQKDIEKYYLAISDRKPKKKQGWVIGDMEKSRRGSWRLTTSKQNPAKTYFVSKALSEGRRLFLLKPFTGKTHQIRVALKSVGSPIVGDLRYQASEVAEKYDRGYLHAYAMRFKLAGKLYQFECPPLSGKFFTEALFTEALLEYKEPWGLSLPSL